MKTLLSVVLLTAALALNASAQTNTNSAPNFPATLQEAFSILGSSIPTGTNIAAATFGLGTGVTLRNGVVQNYIDADWYIKTNFFLRFDIQNAPSASVINRGALGIGVRKADVNYEYGVSLSGVRNWSVDNLGIKPSWQGRIEIMGDCNIVGSTVKSGLKLGFLTDPSQPIKKPPQFEIKLEAFKLYF